jgi:GT2 family glycosyltransferase
MSSILLISIVLFNNEEVIEDCLKSLKRQEYSQYSSNVSILVIDNSSKDNSVAIAKKYLDAEAIIQLPTNIGFCAAHNMAATVAVEKSIPYLLILNPDTIAGPTLISDLLKAFILAEKDDPSIGGAGVLLLRPTAYKDSGDTIDSRREEPIIDSAGITFTSSLRHFDAYSGKPLSSFANISEPSYVAGVTGACLLVSTKFVKAVSFRAKYDDDIERVYPELSVNRKERFQLFDEAFFAYREDAELAWRSIILGWHFILFPNITCIHVRRVTPERRLLLPPEINALGVKNRFLLQLNCWSLWYDSKAFIPGIIVRNILVLLGVVLKEQSSLRAFLEFCLLARRGWYRRRYIMSQRKSKRSIFGRP